MTYTTALMVLEALRLAKAELQARRAGAGTLDAIGRAIVAHTVDMAPPLGCDSVAVPLYLSDMWGNGVAGPAQLIATQDVRASDNTPNARDEYVTVAARIEMPCLLPLDRVDALIRRTRDTLEPA